VCTVSLVDLLIFPPYSLVLNEEVWVKIVAVNFYGESPISDAGNNGLVKLVPDAPIALFNDHLVTDHTQIKLYWQEGLSNGGLVVEDYAIYYDQGSSNTPVFSGSDSDFVLLTQDVLTSYYTTEATLTNDVYYTFKVSARNDVGFSLLSAPITILCAKKPDAPVTLEDVPAVYSVNGLIESGITTANQIGLTWQNGVFDGGSPVLDFRVSIRVNAANETDAAWQVYKAQTNSRPLTVTGLTPSILYDLRVEARNLVNHSDYSEAITIRAAQVPDKPVSLADVPATFSVEGIQTGGITLGDRIGLTWAAPAFNGGAPVLDYRLWFDDGRGDSVFEVKQSGLHLSYIVESLVQGTVYTFKVQARNDYGYSDWSDPVSILAA
jgi:hypothetical protein